MPLNLYRRHRQKRETGRTTISYAIEDLPSNREETEIAPATLKKHRTSTKQLTKFGDSRGYLKFEQFTSGDIDDFSGGSNSRARAKGMRLATPRAFPRFCTNRHWLQEYPISADIEPPMRANCAANNACYTDDYLQRTIDTCNTLGEIVWGNEHEQHVWTGNDAKGLVWIMVSSGLEISDVGLFNMNRAKGNERFSQGKKNGGEVFD